MPKVASPELESQVRTVIERTFSIGPQPSADYSMNTTPQWDSLGHMRLVLELESAFHLRFPSYMLPQLTSLRAITKLLSQRLQA